MSQDDKYPLSKHCCVPQNLIVASADGTRESDVICLTCKVCGAMEPYYLRSRDEMNVAYAFAQYGAGRARSLKERTP